MKVKALKGFIGAEGHVRRGALIDVSERRARELVGRGLVGMDSKSGGKAGGKTGKKKGAMPENNAAQELENEQAPGEPDAGEQESN